MFTQGYVYYIEIILPPLPYPAGYSPVLDKDRISGTNPINIQNSNWLNLLYIFNNILASGHSLGGIATIMKELIL